MLITPISTNYQYKKSTVYPRFSSNFRQVCDIYGNKLYKTTTCYFRDDLDWYFVMDFLCKKYKNVSKVNVINHACSNGMEPLSLVMGLMANHPEDADKFFPVIAKDIDYDNIILAKNGQCGVSEKDFLRVDYYTKNKFREFVEPKLSKSPDDFMILSPKPLIMQKVIFQQGNILEDVSSIPTKNTVLFCRNLWIYLKPNEKEMLAETLGRRLNESCTIIISCLDYTDANAGKLLEKYGFVPQDKDFCWNSIYAKK